MAALEAFAGPPANAIYENRCRKSSRADKSRCIGARDDCLRDPMFWILVPGYDGNRSRIRFSAYSMEASLKPLNYDLTPYNRLLIICGAISG
jgi:hypothetical protein